MTVEDVDHVYVETRRFERAVAFWKALGFEVAESLGPAGHRTRILRAGGARIVLAEVGPSHHPQGPTVHLAIGDAEALDARLSETEHVEVLTPLEDTRWGTRWIRVRDPDGNLYALEAPRGS